jgi:hypothetical protein
MAGAPRSLASQINISGVVLLPPSTGVGQGTYQKC